MSRLTRDGMAESSRVTKFSGANRDRENIHFLCSVNHEQDWQPYPVDPHSTICNNHTYIAGTFNMPTLYQ